VIKALAFALLLSACAKAPQKKSMNPVTYFEIPVTDLDRATRFYEAVFECKLERKTIDGHPMALFPFADGQPGASGALAQGDVYKPTHSGAILYFQTPNAAETLKRANAQGARTLFPVTDVGVAIVAEFEDSEGNRIALQQRK
jgi:predicted enzyme related to lactoylglutathione lyase